MENAISNKELAILEKQVSPLIREAKNLDLLVEADVSLASEYLKQLHETEKNIEKKRKEFTQPLNQSLKAINSTFKKLSEPVSEAKLIVKQKIGAWHRSEQERIAKEEERRRKIQEAHERQGHDVNAPVILERPDSTIGNSMVKKVWTYEIIDETIIPRKFLAVDTVKLRKYMLERKEEAEVPGVRFYQTEQVVVT